jgi:hypothetical protein
MTITEIELTLTVGSEADAGYIKTRFGERSVARTIPIQDGNDHLYGTHPSAASWPHEAMTRTPLTSSRPVTGSAAAFTRTW